MDQEQTQQLLGEIDRFLAASGMGETYFSRQATGGNGHLVARLRSGGRVWPETAQRVRDFIASHDQSEGAGQ